MFRPCPSRQTQNPERGRKPDGTELSGFYQVVVRPKTPRGDGNPHGGTWTSATIGVVGPKTPRGDGNSITLFLSVARLRVSSDPKPREGTETRNPAPHPQLRHAPEVVRPKTPRGDGNARNRPTWACPQRVVRPKTPRGDGNAPWMADALCAQVSSDPKPREGTETSTPSVPHTGPVPCRQTQNPERGRKRISPATPQPRYCSMSSDPKPREGTETTTTGSPPRLLTGIQDEHDGGVDGEDVWS
ncbi:Uncharacterised protein [Mycobacterium tuberculosis]|nr:Uncharacterised protein [Mycobacterium tuberculosis]